LCASPLGPASIHLVRFNCCVLAKGQFSILEMVAMLCFQPDLLHINTKYEIEW
jgi:hypothetical protein